MVRRAHNEFRIFGDLAEFSDDQFVAELRVVEQHIIPLEFRRRDVVVIIGVVANCDVGRFHYIFNEARCLVFVRKYVAWIWNVFHIFHYSRRGKKRQDR